MAKAHNMPIPSGVDPVAALESMPKKPWAYTSGGTLQTLLRTYYRRDRDFTEETKRVAGGEVEVVPLEIIAETSYRA